MNDNDKVPDLESDPTAEAGDVEILEVVGVDDDMPAPPAVSNTDEPTPDEVVFTIDADVEPGMQTDTAPPVTEAQADRAEEVDESSDTEGAQLARLRADYDNLRKRVARERNDFRLQANSELIEGLLPVLDNFDRALQVQIRTGADGAFRAGMVMIYDQFNEALKEQGLRRIDTVGREFDPNLHDAVETDAESEAPANTIIEEYQRGYLFQNRVLRPALVKVSTSGSGVPSPGQNREGR